MRRLTLFISVALALLVFAIPATANAKRSHHHKSRHSLRDRNHNGIPDRWEKKFRVHSASGDPDHDGVTNLGEFHNGTNPRDADSNNNGIDDGQDDANDDGVPDGQEQAGVITSFDATTGKLVITLVNNDTQSGTVTSDTEIECDNPTTTTASTRDGGDDNESGDDSSENSGSTTPPTTTQSGDDDQGDNNDQGDDDQGENQGNCGTDALQAGTIVKEAELRLTSGGAVFKDIELGGKAQA